MNEIENRRDWWSEASIRICHSSLNPTLISELLCATPQVAQRPGESKIPHGSCRSAGFWCLESRAEAPDRPDAAILWAESFVISREAEVAQLLKEGFDVNVYIGIFSNVVALGFEMPPTPTLWKLRIPLGIEFYSK